MTADAGEPIDEEPSGTFDAGEAFIGNLSLFHLKYNLGIPISLAGSFTETSFPSSTLGPPRAMASRARTPPPAGGVGSQLQLTPEQVRQFEANRLKGESPSI